MPLRREEELNQALELVGQADAVNTNLLSENDPTDPPKIAVLGDMSWLRGIQEGIRFALGGSSELIDEVRNQGAERFMRQRDTGRRELTKTALRRTMGDERAKRMFGDK